MGQELNTDVIQNADLLVCDLLSQTKERGEFQNARFENDKLLGRIQELGKYLANLRNNLGEENELLKKNSSNANVLSIFDSSGMALQDVNIAALLSSEMI